MMLHVLLQVTLMFIYLNVATNVEFTTFFFPPSCTHLLQKQKSMHQYFWTSRNRMVEGS